ncbi:MAG: very short patch repair endonuclease [Caulobacterales bacterium]
MSISADKFDAKTRSAVMRAVKSKDTAPEMKVRRLAHALGYRYRLHRKDLPGAPDLTFPRLRKVIFVHGCFWHGHDCARGARMPKANQEYWRAKIIRNKTRDGQTQERLKSLGWAVLTIWECELRAEAELKARVTAFLTEYGVNERGNPVNS